MRRIDVALGLVLLSLSSPARAEDPSATPSAASTPPPPSVAPSPAKALDDMSLEELLDVRIDVASKKATTVRESPGVVTLVTREEIINSGARDLIDVLSLVPGFTFGVDVGGVIGVGFRGNWGHEGKVLLLVDGVMMNEVLYSSTQFGNRLPVEEIERIEIVRGPGSAVYGGYAELAVINVRTRRGHDLQGGTAFARGGEMQSGFGDADAGLAAGKEFDGGLEVSVSGYWGEGRRSDATFTDFYGSTFPMSREKNNPRFLNVGASWRGLSLRVLFDDFYTRTQDGYGTITTRPFNQRFDASDADLSWAARVSDKLTITPRFTILHQAPWRTTDADPLGTYYDKTAERITGGVSASWDPAEQFNALGGIEAYQDTAWLNGPMGIGFQTPLTADGKPSVQYRNGAVYSQVLWTNPIVDLALGARFERHSQFGNSFVPRAALTKVIDRFHVKLLYSDSFRAPGIENIAINPTIEPERTRVFEAEAGMRATENIFVSVNAFDTTIHHPIVYAVLGTATEGYFNFDRSGTTGGELDVHARFPGGYVNASASFATPAGKNRVALYQVPGHGDYMLAFPHWKLALNSSFTILRGVTLAPSAVVLGERYGFLKGDGAGTGLVGRLEPSVVLNAFVNTRSLLFKGLDVGAGVFDILNSKPPFVQPYDGGHAPLPGPSRTYAARASYSF